MQHWAVQDRYGNTIYFTEERWRHVLASRPELEPHFELFLDTVRTGKRQQDALVANEYRYVKRYPALLPENNVLVVVVVFKQRLDDAGRTFANNFVVTGWANYVWSQE